MTSAAALLAAGPAVAEEVKPGISFGFPGPLETMPPDMARAEEAAMTEALASGQFLADDTIRAVRADYTSIDAAAASAAVGRRITADKVRAIIGGMCPGKTTASLQKVAVPNAMVMISPSATSPALSTVEDKGLFLRTVPSGVRQGEVMGQIIPDHGIKTVTVTCSNNDYGKGLADSFVVSFPKAGVATRNRRTLRRRQSRLFSRGRGTRFRRGRHDAGGQAETSKSGSRPKRTGTEKSRPDFAFVSEDQGVTDDYHRKAA